MNSSVRIGIARTISRTLRPVYAWRGRIVGRTFTQSSRWYDVKARSYLERIMNAFEMWEAKPGLERMEAMAAEMEDLAVRIEAFKEEFLGSDADRVARLHAVGICACESDVEDPGPHLPSCKWADPDYEP